MNENETNDLTKEFASETGHGTGFLSGFLSGVLTMTLIAVLLMIFFGVRYFRETREQVNAFKESLAESASLAAEKYADDPLAERLAEVNAYLRQHMVLEIDQDKMMETALKAYIMASGDPYSAYMTAAELEDLITSSNGSYVGIGVRISQNPNTMECAIIQVFPGSPAEEAGLKVGDIFKAVGGVPVAEMESDNLVVLVRGESGSRVEVTVYRPETDSLYTTDVERRQVEVVTVKSRMLTDTIGYIALEEFEDVSIGQVKEALETLKKQGMKQLVFDLRSNPGGLLNSVQGISDYFLEKGQLLLSMKDKQGKEFVFFSENAPIFRGDMVVLVNGGSASASEVMTGALKDYGRALIMGTQTFGKGIVQSFFYLQDGGGLKLTTEHYFTPLGNYIHGVGISPDVEMQDDPATADVDELIEAAVRKLKETK